MENDAFFIQDKERFFSTEHTRGPWSPDLQHGGPPSALLARAIEQQLEEAFFVARLSVEFLRPVPIVPLSISVKVARAGKKVKRLDALLEADGKEVCRATAVCIRQASLPLPEVLDPPPPLPEESAPFEMSFFTHPVGYHRAMEVRVARGSFGSGELAAWMRMRYPLVAGEDPSPLQRVLCAADSGNGVSLLLDIHRYTFINPDLTVYLHRPLVGEWICLDARTIPQPHGIGLAESRLFDTRGAIGRSLQSLVIEERGA